MEKPIQFFREVWQEMSRVTWPGKQETISTSIMVLIMVLVASGFFMLIDMGVFHMVQFILSIGS